jgi:hypothetical protein
MTSCWWELETDAANARGRRVTERIRKRAFPNPLMQMPGKPKSKSEIESLDQRSPVETERIREATLKRILNTPSKRHAEMIAKRKAKRRPSKGTNKGVRIYLP